LLAGNYSLLLYLLGLWPAAGTLLFSAFDKKKELWCEGLTGVAVMINQLLLFCDTT
jgi:hypothetical protein